MGNLLGLWQPPHIQPHGYRIVKGSCGNAHDNLPEVEKKGGSYKIKEERVERLKMLAAYLRCIGPEKMVTIKHLVRDLGGCKQTMGIDLKELEKRGEIQSYATIHNRKSYWGRK